MYGSFFFGSYGWKLRNGESAAAPTGRADVAGAAFDLSFMVSWSEFLDCLAGDFFREAVLAASALGRFGWWLFGVLRASSARAAGLSAAAFRLAAPSASRAGAFFAAALPASARLRGGLFAGVCFAGAFLTTFFCAAAFFCVAALLFAVAFFGAGARFALALLAAAFFTGALLADDFPAAARFAAALPVADPAAVAVLRLGVLAVFLEADFAAVFALDRLEAFALDAAMICLWFLTRSSRPRTADAWKSKGA